MRSPYPAGRRVRWTSIGFLAGYLAGYGLSLAEATTTSHFEVLYGGPRPEGVLAWLQFQHASEAVYVVTGVVGALLGLVASFAHRRGVATQRAT